MIEFQNKLEKNSQEIDVFLDRYLPSGNGLNSKLFESMNKNELLRWLIQQQLIHYILI